MAIQLSEAHLAEIRAHGGDAFPQECCGALLGSVEGDSKTVQEIRRLSNAFQSSAEFEAVTVGEQTAQAQPTPGQERRYMVSPDVMFALMREERQTGRKILGFYHSHPNHPARPSLYDRDWASPWYCYLIVSVMEGAPGELTAWTLNDNNEFQPETLTAAQN